jgi:general secretion pathway protein L
MPADREFALPGGGFRLRDFARRHGLTGFWRWWTRELAALVPAGPRAAVARRRTRPVLEFAADAAKLWRPAVDGGHLGMAEVARIGLAGDPAAVAAEGRSVLASAFSGAGAPKVLIALAGRSVLRKRLTLPAALEDDLRTALGYDLDRHTPFKPDELYFDAVVVDRDNARGQISVDLAAARRAQVDTAIRHAQAWGAIVTAVVPEAPAHAAASHLNLLPPEMRNGTAAWKRWQFWLPIGLVTLVALVALVLPVWQKREYAIVLNQVAAEAFQQAAVSESLRTELERQVGDYNFALERKYAYPGAVQILEDVTRLLPDDTWLTQLEVKTVGRGKEAQRELMIRGESVNAGRLVTLLEESKLFTQAAPRSPTTKIQPGPGEIFDLSAQMKPLAPPTAVPLVPAEAPAASAAASGAAASGATASTPSPAGVAAPVQAAPAQAAVPAQSVPSVQPATSTQATPSVQTTPSNGAAPQPGIPAQASAPAPATPAAADSPPVRANADGAAAPSPDRSDTPAAGGRT